MGNLLRFLSIFDWCKRKTLNGKIVFIFVVWMFCGLVYALTLCIIFILKNCACLLVTSWFNSTATTVYTFKIDINVYTKGIEL